VDEGEEERGFGAEGNYKEAGVPHPRRRLRAAGARRRRRHRRRAPRALSAAGRRGRRRQDHEHGAPHRVRRGTYLLTGTCVFSSHHSSIISRWIIY